jgi:pyruvate, water dikinase
LEYILHSGFLELPTGAATMVNRSNFTLDFNQIALTDIARVGGKNASLGQLFNALRPAGINLLDGFTITVDAYRHLLSENSLNIRLRELLSGFNPEDVKELSQRGHAAQRYQTLNNRPVFYPSIR